MLGIGEMLPEESLSDAKKQTVKIFREELKRVVISCINDNSTLSRSFLN